MRRLVQILALCLATAALVAGCGDGKKGDDYAKAVNDAQTVLAKRFDRLQSRISATSTPKQDRTTLHAYESAVNEAVGALRAVDPPKDVAMLHRQYIDEIADYGTEVRRARATIGNGTPQRVLEVQRRLVTSIGRITARINDTIAEINRKLRG